MAIVARVHVGAGRPQCHGTPSSSSSSSSSSLMRQGMRSSLPVQSFTSTSVCMAVQKGHGCRRTTTLYRGLTVSRQAVSNTPSSSSSSSIDTDDDNDDNDDDDDEIFNPKNQIPGTYRDAMNSKTELGAAIKDACSELDALKSLEEGVIQEAEELLKGVGFKGSLYSLTGSDGQEQQDADDDSIYTDTGQSIGIGDGHQSDKRLILTDAMALLYRSHFAFPHSNNHRLMTSKGRDTTVEFGFISTLLSLLELMPRPTHMAVVFDASGKTFRHELYQGYKGQRPPAPEEVVDAIPVVLEVLKAMNVMSVRVPGVEADDVIGTLARRAVEEEDMTVAVASPDKDFFQLLRPGLILLRPPKKNQQYYDASQKYSLVPYSEDEFEEEWQGLVPSQFVDVLALMGDSSDNVPGVPGIGPKMAVSLLKQFGTLEEVLARRDEATPKRAATALSTEDAVAAARLSKQLVELRMDVDVPATNIDIDAALRLRVPEDGGREVWRLFDELEFASHEKRLRALWNTSLRM